MYIVIFITCANEKEAKRIASALLKKRLIACANIIDRIKSIFWWQDKLDKAEEALLILKSKKSRLAKIIKQVKLLHSYQVPEIIALPVLGGSESYLRWLDEEIY